jgi:phage terminase large subunit GpA-like protein
MNVVEKSARDGKPYPDGLQRWAINTDTYKQDLQSRWTRDLGSGGTWLLTAASLEEAETYLRQITNEGRIAKLNERTRRIEMRWQVIDPGVGNHFFDTEVYARALADMVTGGVWEGLGEEAKQAATTEPGGRSRTHYGDSRPDGRDWLDVGR